MNFRVSAAVVSCIVCGVLFQSVSACEFGKKSTDSYQTIGLGDAEIKKLEEYRVEVKTTRDAALKEIEELKEHINKELLKPEPSRKTLTAYSKKQGELRSEISAARAKALMKAKKLVDEKQFGKLVAMDWGCRCTEGTSRQAGEKPGK